MSTEIDKIVEEVKSLAPAERRQLLERLEKEERYAEGRSPTARRPGTLRGTVTYMAPDFDAPVDEFQEYME